VLAAREAFADWRAERYAKAEDKLNGEIQQLCRDISCYPGPRLTTEDVPQFFNSEGEAQAFGQKWSRGGQGSF
jgi:hypothetical protein